MMMNEPELKNLLFGRENLIMPKEEPKITALQRRNIRRAMHTRRGLRTHHATLLIKRLAWLERQYVLLKSKLETVADG